MQPLFELIRQRLVNGSRPGQRNDPYRLVLAIEGGATRAMFAVGMARALDEIGLVSCFDAIYGASAGAWIGAWLLSGRSSIGLSTSWWNASVKRLVFQPGRLLRGRPIIDVEQAARVCEALAPRFFESVRTHPVPLHPLAMNARTGDSTDLHRFACDDHTLGLALRATVALPGLTGPAIELCGQWWLDGGIAENVPFATPIRDGATHLLLLRNRRLDERPRSVWWLAGVDRLAPPQLRVVCRARAGRFQQERTLDQVAGVYVTQLRPPRDSLAVFPLRADLRLLRRVAAIGHAAAYTALAPVAERPARAPTYRING